MPQLATWQVVIGKGMVVGHVGTHPYQSQFAMWQVVAQSCAKSCPWHNSTFLGLEIGLEGNK